MEAAVEFYPVEELPGLIDVSIASLAVGGLHLVTEASLENEPPVYEAKQYVDPELVRHNSDRFAFERMAQHKILTKTEEVKLAKCIETGDIKAKEELISHNYRLVIKIAGEYIGVSSLSHLELVQEGIIGLNRAAEKFDWRRNFKFSTYSAFWIRQTILLAIKASDTIRLPVEVGQHRRSLYDVETQLLQELKRQPTITELAEAAGMTEEETQASLSVAVVTASLNQPIGEDGTGELGDLMVDGLLLPIDEIISDLNREEIIRQIVSNLPELLQTVLTLRYGLDDGVERTFEEIGAKLGLSATKISEIESQALDMIRENYVKRGMIEFAAPPKKPLEGSANSPAVKYEDPADNQVYELTAHQETILNLMGLGETYESIASQLDLTYGQVKYKAQQAYIILGVSEKDERKADTARRAISKRHSLTRLEAT